MYVFIGLSRKKFRSIVSVGYDPVDKSDREAIPRCWEWALDQDEVSVVELWNLESNKVVCVLEV